MDGLSKSRLSGCLSTRGYDGEHPLLHGSQNPRTTPPPGMEFVRVGLHSLAVVVLGFGISHVMNVFLEIPHEPIC